MALRPFAIGFALLVCSCATEQPSTPPPLVPEAQTATGTGTRPVPAIRPRESKTIGGDPYSLRGPNGGAPSTQSTQTPGRSNAWSPTPVNGNMNPSPPGPTTPVYGDMNPSPPGR